MQTPARPSPLLALRGSFVLMLALLSLLLVPSCSRRRGGGEEQETAGAEAVAVALAPRELVGALALDPELLHRVRTLTDVEALCVAGSNEPATPSTRTATAASTRAAAPIALATCRSP
ncbi:MAG: hypothetical protein IPG81_19420 [Sandaracinaceae bacterium]|nr:hypothetical protein [Sandaracinaceae bacterium]